MKVLGVKFCFFIVLALSLLVTSVSGQFIASPDKTLALTNAVVIDGNGGRPQPRKTIIISGGRIIDIFSSGKKRLPGGAIVINLSGQYAIPGLIDSHYHLNLGTRSSAQETALQRFALLGGVTAVRDMAGDAIALAELAKAAREGKFQSPRIYFSALFAGKSWFVDQRVKIIMHGLPAGEAAWARAIEPGTDIAQAVTEAKAAGATGIKLYADLPPVTVAKITKEAHRQNLKVWSHATIFPTKPSEAVKAGVDVISHNNLLVWELVKDMPAVSDKATNAMVGWTKVSIDAPEMTALLREMHRRGTMLDDTAIWTKLRLVPAIEKSEAAKPAAERTPGLAAAIENWTFGIVKRAHELGVRMVAGTDFQEHPESQDFPNIHAELELLVTRCGLTPLEAITAATRSGATTLGIQNSYGTIAKGKIADLVILNADPSIDIRNTTKIAYVIKGGNLYKREKVVMPEIEK